MTSALAKTIVVASLVALSVAACGSDDPDRELASAPAPTPTAIESVVEATVVETPTADAEQEADERTAEEVAIGKLDVMIYQLGGRDLEGVTTCIVDRLASEGVELTGEGSPDLVAALGCEPDLVDGLIRLDPTAAPEQTRDCVTRTIGAWMASLPLTEASTFFQAAAPPAELVADLSAECDLSEDAVLALIG